MNLKVLIGAVIIQKGDYDCGLNRSRLAQV